MYLKRQVKKCLENPQYAFGILGSKGYGKSSIVIQTAEEMGYKVVDIRLSSSDETDVGGLPRVINDEYFDYMPPKWLVDLCKDTDNKYLILLDECNQALPECLNAIFPLILASINGDKVEKHLAGMKIPNQTAICLLGNTEEDNPFLTELPEALSDRVLWLPFKAEIKYYKDYIVNKYGSLGEEYYNQFSEVNILNPRQIDQFLWICQTKLIDNNPIQFIKKNFTEVSDVARDLNIFYEHSDNIKLTDKSFDLKKNYEDDEEFLEKL